MPALGSSAATATELTWTTRQWQDLPAPYGGPGDLLHLISEVHQVVFTGGSGEQQWAKVRIGNYGIVWWALSCLIGGPGGSGGTYAGTSYYSNDPAEDGTTLTAHNSFGGTGLGSGLSGVGEDGQPAAYWLYIEMECTGTPTAETGTIYFDAQGKLEWDSSSANGSGYSPRGSTTVGIFGPQNVRGTTDVGIYLLATDDLASAPDLSAAGTFLTGGTGGWQPPVTAEASEPVITLTGGGITWTKTTWHRFYMPAAGTIRFSDDDTRALAAIDPASGVGGTVMAIYTGPPAADYPDLVFLVGGDLVVEGSLIGGAVQEATVGSATWLYIQHAYVGTTDDLAGSDGSTLHLQVMSWAPATPPGTIVGDPDEVDGETTLFILRWYPDEVDGFALVRATASITAPRGVGHPDEVDGSTSVSITAPDYIVGTPDTVNSIGFCAVVHTPDLSDNPPVGLALALSGDLFIGPPDTDDEDVPPVNRRSMPIIVISVPAPIVVGGKPTLPAYVGTLSSSATTIEGANHIRAIAPAPVWDGSGYVNPPPPTTYPWAARWVVDDLPDPPSHGFYWLGDPSTHDGTSGITSAARQWSPHGSVPHAPAWRSFFPYKPSVRAVDSYLPDGGIVHHDKGVHFNSQFVEHMWLDFGGSRRQPFTWVIAGLIAGDPTRGYTHHILDSGRNPDAVGFPRLSASQVYQSRTINDGLGYRNLLTYGNGAEVMCARTGDFGSHAIRLRATMNTNPRMFFGVFDGGKSVVGNWAPGGLQQAGGSIDNTAAQQHRYYVLGRRNGYISQGSASHILVFEVRFWTYALSAAELKEQYGQLSSTYQFDKYRRL